MREVLLKAIGEVMDTTETTENPVYIERKCFCCGGHDNLRAVAKGIWYCRSCRYTEYGENAGNQRYQNG